MGNLLSTGDNNLDQELDTLLSRDSTIELNVRLVMRKDATPSMRRLRISAKTPLDDLERDLSTILASGPPVTAFTLSYMNLNGYTVPIDDEESFCQAKFQAVKQEGPLTVTCDVLAPSAHAAAPGEGVDKWLREAFCEGGEMSDACSSLSDPDSTTHQQIGGGANLVPSAAEVQGGKTVALRQQESHTANPAAKAPAYSMGRSSSADREARVTVSEMPTSAMSYIGYPAPWQAGFGYGGFQSTPFNYPGGYPGVAFSNVTFGQRPF